MKTIFTNFAPNVEADDALRAVWLMFQPWQWRVGNYAGVLEDWFRDYLGVTHASAFDSGRSALYAILKSLNLEARSEVLLQAYTCVAVPNPVIWADLKPIYVDIDPETLNLNPADLAKKITPQSRVLIVQHTFGKPAKLEALLKIARENNLIVIEDCAHALGAEYQNQKIGTFGDAAFFSFGRDKVVSAVFGGVAVAKNPTIGKAIAKLQDEFPLPARAWVFRQLLHPIITYLVRHTYDLMGLGKTFYAAIRKTKLLSRAVYPEERLSQKPPFVMKKMSNALAGLALHQLEKLERYNYHRHQIAAQYQEALAPLGLAAPATDAAAARVWLRYVFFTKKANDLRAYAKRRKILLGDWYTEAIAPDRVEYARLRYQPVTCPNAEILSRQTINLPTDINISEADASRVAEMIRKYFHNDD